MVKRKIDHAREAAEALSDMNVLYAIIALTENSLMHNCYKAEVQIGKICRNRSQYLLRKYDWHMAAITHREGE